MQNHWCPQMMQYLRVQLIVHLLVLVLGEKFCTVNNKFGAYNMRYFHHTTAATSDAAALVCIHGFGGNAKQFRKNLPVLSQNGHDTYALDLLGYGYSDKPNPKLFRTNEFYNFDTWSEQTVQFVDQTVGKPSVLVCNSVGGLVGLQAAITRPDLIKGVVLINMSLRMLHIKKQKLYLRPIISGLQTLLRETRLGTVFFNQLLSPPVLRTILNQAYGYQNVTETGGIDEETLNVILQPGLDPRAADVFLDFTSYSTGPLPEELLAQVNCPVSILWGELDPWEPLELGRATFAGFPCVRDFTVLPGGGHCPMDQIPDVVNENVLRFLREHKEYFL